MKRFLLALMIFAAASTSFYALSNRAGRIQQQLRDDQTGWLLETQRLAEIEAECAALTVKVKDLKHELRSGASTAMDSVVANTLLTNGLNSAPLEVQNKLLEKFGLGRNSTRDYVIVAKAILQDATMKAVKTPPHANKLTDAIRSVLAITSEEQHSVEGALDEASNEVSVWAKSHIQREGPSGDLLVRYTIPADPEFKQASTNKLFSTINETLGIERGTIFNDSLRHSRLVDGGAIGEYTNKLSILRVPGKTGLFFQSGWEWSERRGSLSSTIHVPEPITQRFPNSFLSVFPGGWQEIAQREGFELPEFQQQPGNP